MEDELRQVTGKLIASEETILRLKNHADGKVQQHHQEQAALNNRVAALQESLKKVQGMLKRWGLPPSTRSFMIRSTS